MKKSFLFFLVVLMAKNCFAQQETEMKKMLDDIGVLAGAWKVSVEARLSPQGPWDSSTGKSVIKKTLHSKILEEDFTGSRQGKPFVIKCLIAINNQNGKYQRIFVDSEHGTLVDFAGEKNGNDFIFDKEWTYANKSTVNLRVIYKMVSRNEFVVESMRMPEGTSAWDITGRMKYSRQSK